MSYGGGIAEYRNKPTKAFDPKSFEEKYSKSMELILKKNQKIED